ncbi:glycosyltransferase [Escherichia coli]|uniref:glycosyltransferase n=1 Tax=Escherichia coli TaxID=562 RepID=UPI0034583769
MQTEWMRKAVIDKLNLSEKKISIIRPVIDIDLNKILKNENENENENENTFIYPAASYSYKNHIILVESLNMIGVDFLFQNKITVIFTLDRDENSKLFDRIKKYNLQEIIKFTGNIPRYDVLNYIYNAKALLFPSRLETFGIPLIEAVKFNSNIIVSDLPYAHDVLDGYENVKYCNPDSPEDWSEAIKFAINLKENKLNQGFELNSGWRELSSIISTL